MVDVLDTIKNSMLDSSMMKKAPTKKPLDSADAGTQQLQSALMNRHQRMSPMKHTGRPAPPKR